MSTFTASEPRLHAARTTQRESAPPLAWRHLAYEVRGGASNMALDHALALEAGVSGVGVVRLYGWARATLSLGRNEPSTQYDIDRLRSEGVDVVRRPTGGRAVLHARELTYSVIAPDRALGGARKGYRCVNEALACALRRLGADVELATGIGGRSPGPDAGPCFRAPAPGEVVARGRKLVGSAQARIGGALLQHGSILLEGRQDGAGWAPRTLAEGPFPVTLRELIGDVSIDEVARVVADSLRMGLGGTWSEDEAGASERAVAAELESDRYTRDSWTLRR